APWAASYLTRPRTGKGIGITKVGRRTVKIVRCARIVSLRKANSARLPDIFGKMKKKKYVPISARRAEKNCTSYEARPSNGVTRMRKNSMVSATQGDGGASLSRNRLI